MSAMQPESALRSDVSAGKYAGIFPALLLSAVIYVPILGLPFDAIQLHLKTVSYVLIAFLCSVSLFRSFGAKQVNFSLFAPILILNISLLIISGLGYLFGQYDLDNFLFYNQGFFLCTSIICYLATFNDRSLAPMLNKMAIIITVALVVQFIFSAYESYHGVILTERFEGANIGDRFYSTKMSSRLILNLFGFDIAELLPFQIPFSGMMGAHNRWGTQLPFYNLLFWCQYLTKRNRLWYIPIGLTLLATFFNTSRFGIAAVLVTDIFIFYHFILSTKGVRLLGIFSGILLLAIVASFFGASAEAYYVDNNTLSDRIYKFGYVWTYIFDRDIVEIALGSGAFGTQALQLKLFGETLSFENQFQDTLMVHGIFGLLLVGWILTSFMQKAWNRRDHDYYIGVLIGVNVILVSIPYTHIFNYACYAIVPLVMAHLDPSLYAQKVNKINLNKPKSGKNWSQAESNGLNTIGPRFLQPS
jgi:hypothetical protein